MSDFLIKLTSVKPSEQQVNWQSLGFTAFLHFGINTFTNREWGDGSEDPNCYNPTNLNTDQWCEALKSAGITACILTAKHHDGFCLFDTKYTSHSAMNSPKPIDVVAELAKSCKKYDLKLGVYLSPWDRNAKSYGSGKAYDDYFCAQLEELTTNYGELYAVWFDGACGEGPNGKKQVYDWTRYYSLIRKNQPQAVISVCGPDVRWIGNEAGYTRPSEWSVVPKRLRNAETTASLSQQEDNISFREKPISSQDHDLGSREFLKTELDLGGDLCWYPAEVDVSIRPGWFYHKEEDDKVRSLDNLLDIYEKSVGGNALLLLNIPPDTNGEINQADTVRLKELGRKINSIFSENLFENANISIDGVNHPTLLTGDNNYWVGNEEKATIKISLPNAKALSHIVLCEEIRQGQRIEAFNITAEVSGKTIEICKGTTVGFKKICRFEEVCTKELSINITESRIAPTLKFIGGYKE